MEKAPSGPDSSFADKDTVLVGLSPKAEPETGSECKQCIWEVAVTGRASEDVRGGRAGKNTGCLMSRVALRAPGTLPLGSSGKLNHTHLQCLLFKGTGRGSSCPSSCLSFVAGCPWGQELPASLACPTVGAAACSQRRPQAESGRDVPLA